MLQLAIYGKGGIGKSTISCNLSAILTKKGLTVMQVGCDPKADSTALLHNGERIPTVLQLTRERGKNIALGDAVCLSPSGVYCAEAGGPPAGLGCAGRGIINALETLEKLGAYDTYKPDIVIYDVLGDVVCGGFAMPMRKGYADKVIVVTSGERMSLYAGANICMATENFKGRGYAQLGGIILNRRNVPDEDQQVQNLADDFHTSILGAIDRSNDFQEAEKLNQTLLEYAPESAVCSQLNAIAEKICEGLS